MHSVRLDGKRLGASSHEPKPKTNGLSQRLMTGSVLTAFSAATTFVASSNGASKAKWFTIWAGVRRAEELHGFSLLVVWKQGIPRESNWLSNAQPLNTINLAGRRHSN